MMVPQVIRAFGRRLLPFDYQELTVDGTVRSLDADKVALADVGIVRFHAAPVRYTCAVAAGNPVAGGPGELAGDLDVEAMNRDELDQLRLVRDDVTNATVRVRYYKVLLGALAALLFSAGAAFAQGTVNIKTLPGTTLDVLCTNCTGLISDGTLRNGLGPGQANVINTDPVGTEYGLVVRPIGGASGGGTQYDQGTAATDTDKLMMAGCVRADTAAVATGVANGDRARCVVDSTGRLWVHVGVIDGTVTVTGPLTDAQLRATPVPVSGTVTANVGTTGGLALDATLTSRLPAALVGGRLDVNVGNIPHVVVDSGAVTVSGTVTANQGGAPWSMTGSGNFTVVQGTGTNLHVVVDAAPTTAVTCANCSGTVAVSGPLTDAQLRASAVATDPSDRAGRLLGHVTVDNASLAVTGTFFQATQPVSAAALPLPANAAQETGGNLGTIAGKDFATQTTLAALNTKVPADPAREGGNLATVATNTTGVSTAANQTTGNASLSSIDTKLSSQATAAKQDTGNASLASIDTKTIAGTVSSANSSTTPLLATATFTGTFESVKNYAFLTFSVYADQASALSGLVFDWSHDGTNVDVSESSDVLAATGRAFAMAPRAQFFRVRYTNGSTDQGALRLGTVYHPNGTGIITKPLDGALTTENFAQQVKAVVAVKDMIGSGFSNQVSGPGPSGNGVARVTIANDNVITTISMPSLLQRCNPVRRDGCR